METAVLRTHRLYPRPAVATNAVARARWTLHHSQVPNRHLGVCAGQVEFMTHWTQVLLFVSQRRSTPVVHWELFWHWTHRFVVVSQDGLAGLVQSPDVRHCTQCELVVLQTGSAALPPASTPHWVLLVQVKMHWLFVHVLVPPVH